MNVDVYHPSFGKAFPCEECNGPTGPTFNNFKLVKGTKEALQTAKAFANGDLVWAVLRGNVGTGKTHLARAACAHIVYQRRIWPNFWQVADLLDAYRLAYEDKDSSGLDSRLTSRSPLVLDDLGSHKATEWVQEKLTIAVDWRYSRGLPTLVTTNLDYPQMAELLGPRLASRVWDRNRNVIAVLDCPDYRMEN